MAGTLPRRMKTLIASIALAALLGPALYAQTPAADWQTIETAHFRVHYPREYEAWATRAAERLESIRDAVTKEVGFVPTQTVDVLVTNPIAEPNGSAWPLLDTPRIIFFAEPPAPDEQLGAYGHWIDLLAVHETAHVVHMLRPSRNTFERLIETSVLPLNPITLHAPRWVLEGYATVVEGRLTGAGRPTSTIRALVLRRWAQSGRLPGYGALNSDQRFLGMSMAYLMGSAYLEWLEQRSGPDSLRKLWARMTARQRRSFDEAFIGVFGERPDVLYGRFIAELTSSAMTIDRENVLREGELFQETPRASGEPAVSPDGTQLVVVIRDRDKPEKLVIWSTSEASEEEKKYAERIGKILARDPEDVPPVRTKPLPRKAKHSLVLRDGGDIRYPRWTRDGKAIVFSHRATDADGMLHFDLYRWDFEKVTRITHGADVRDADPLPDGRTAVAVRNRYGASQLVNVDLTNGVVTPRGEASVDEVETHPRVSPDGTRVAHVAHRGARWNLYISDEKGDERIELPGDPSSPEWISDDKLVVTLFTRGFAELFLVRSNQTITRTAGGAFDPAPSRDGRIFFMSLQPDGYVVRVLPSRPSIGEVPPLQSAGASLVPAIPAEPARAPAFATGAFTQHAYGIGRQEFGWLVGENFGPEQQSFEAGVRLGDVVGRLDTLAIASIGDVRGGAIAAAWRGWPVEVDAHAFASNVDDGLELRGIWTHRWPLNRLTLEAGALSDDFAFASAQFATRQVLGTMRFDESITVQADGDHRRGIATASYSGGSFRVGARYQHDEGERVALGGLASSILPRSAYARRVLDPALPVAILASGAYDGWRIETTVPGMPLTAFYQRHEIGETTLSLAGAELTARTDPFPILKLPGLALTLGAAYVFDAPLEGETKFWLGMRWRP